MKVADLLRDFLVDNGYDATVYVYADESWEVSVSLRPDRFYKIYFTRDRKKDYLIRTSYLGNKLGDIINLKHPNSLGKILKIIDYIRGNVHYL